MRPSRTNEQVFCPYGPAYRPAVGAVPAGAPTPPTAPDWGFEFVAWLTYSAPEVGWEGCTCGVRRRRPHGCTLLSAAAPASPGCAVPGENHPPLQALHRAIRCWARWPHGTPSDALLPEC